VRKSSRRIHTIQGTVHYTRHHKAPCTKHKAQSTKHKAQSTMYHIPRTTHHAPCTTHHAPRTILTPAPQGSRRGGGKSAEERGSKPRRLCNIHVFCDAVVWCICLREGHKGGAFSVLHVLHCTAIVQLRQKEEEGSRRENKGPRRENKGRRDDRRRRAGGVGTMRARTHVPDSAHRSLPPTDLATFLNTSKLKSGVSRPQDVA
jgi:hypothetical protein